MPTVMEQLNGLSMVDALVLIPRLNAGLSFMEAHTLIQAIKVSQA